MTKSCRGWFWHFGLASSLAIGYAIAASRDCALTQITPDGTLGGESSVVTPSVDPAAVVISGGAKRGGNLFHSFREFSVPTGGAARFNNGLEIQNIITRVTGASISNIDGLIRANGTANLFLLNPNGIIFGPNASLNIGGSFLASTASSLNFADGTQFSATAPQTPLLTVSVPIGLQFGGNAGSIQVQGNGQGIRTTTDLIDTPVSLRVQPNQTLALVGGDVALSGGTLKTAGGRIELGSVAGLGLVSLTAIDKGFSLGYDSVPTFGNINLSQQAAVDASGAGGGDIQVQGSQVTLTDGSRIEASTLGSGLGGTLSVNASESLELSGTSAEDSQTPTALAAIVYPGATGTGGNLNLQTRQLIVQDGAELSGETVLSNPEPLPTQIVPDATLPNNSSVTTSGNTSIITGGTEAGTNLFHSFEQFSVSTGGEAFFNNAPDIRNIISRVTGESLSNIDGTIRANVSANLFLLNPNGIIFGPNASLNIGGSFLASTASSLNFADGTQFSANAPQTTSLVTVTVPIGLQFEGTTGSILNQSQATNSSGERVGLQVQPGRTLALVGGDVALERGSLTAEEGRIELGSVGSPSLVSLTPTEQGWALDYEGVQNFQNIQLSQGVFGSGDNIQMRGRQVTLVRSEIGSITNQAVPASEPFEVIGTDASGDTAARTLTIETEQLTFRDLAASETGPETSGDTAAGDLTIAIGNLTAQDGASVSIVAFGCPAVGENKFIITGHGGLPPTPREALASEPALADLGTPIQSGENRALAAIPTNPTNPITESAITRIVEAQGWVINDKGEVILTAQASIVTPHSPRLPAANCHTNQTSS